jgi:hypothetical protein
MPQKTGSKVPSKQRYRDEPDFDLLYPSHVPDVRAVLGLVGAGTKRGQWRLYLSLTFNEYLEFLETDVVHSQCLTDEESQVGGTVVWFRRDSNPVHVRTTSREAQAGFLDGEMTGRFLHRANPAAASPFAPGIGAFLAGGCHTGGDFDTLCAACTAVPTALIAPGLRVRAS